MKISHMKKDELFEGFYLIKSADLRQTRAGKNYLAFTFQDDSGKSKESFGMLNLITLRPLLQEKLSTCKDVVKFTTTLHR